MEYWAPCPVLQVRPALVVTRSNFLTSLQEPPEADLGLKSALGRWKVFLVASHSVALDYQITSVWCMPCGNGACHYNVQADAEQHTQAVGDTEKHSRTLEETELVHVDNLELEFKFASQG